MSNEKKKKNDNNRVLKKDTISFNSIDLKLRENGPTWPAPLLFCKLRSHEQIFCATFRTPCSLCWQISVGL